MSDAMDGKKINTRWMCGVVDSMASDDGATAVLAYLAEPDALDDVVRRVRAGGWQRLSRHEWENGIWPLARSGSLYGAVDVYHGELIRFTTGRASLYFLPARDRGLPMTPLWMAAARARRRALVVVLPNDPTAVDSTPALFEVLNTAAAARTLWAGLCEARFDVFHPSMRAPAWPYPIGS